MRAGNTFRELGRAAPDVAAGLPHCPSPQPFAWLRSVPGIPADWPSAQPIGSGNGLALAQLHGGMPLDMTFHSTNHR